jgi:hypothetical protein
MSVVREFVERTLLTENVADTIRQQIGQRALYMLGAKNLVGDHNSLTFRIGRNAKSITHVRVTLDPSDTYTVETLRATVSSNKVLSKVSDIYVDQLRSTIAHATGMALSL